MSIIPIIKKFRLASNLNPPAVLRDGNTVAWYDYKDLPTLTIDGANAVSRWNDKLGSGHDLLQATGTNQPLYTADGILFDGIDNFMDSSFIWTQYKTIYLILKQISWAKDFYIFDNYDTNTMVLYQNTTTPGLVLNAGNDLPQNNLDFDVFKPIIAVYNGANSKLQIGDTIVTGDAGANYGNGFTLAAPHSANVLFSNIKVKAIILRNVVDNAVNELSIYNYLKGICNI